MIFVNESFLIFVKDIRERLFCSGGFVMIRVSFLKTCLLTGAIIIFCTFSLPAKTMKVPTDYAAIQEAIDASLDGDKIIVSEGIYYEAVNFKGKNIVLQSESPTSPSVVENTIITWRDGFPDHPIVTFKGEENDECILSGFTITHGKTGTYPGIQGNGACATVMHNRIINNGGKEEGDTGACGGIAGCHGLIYSNYIADNLSWMNGGGLYNCNGRIEGNIITGNQAGRIYGGGLAYCHGVIRNNEISNNHTPLYGGGVANSDGIVENNLITGNSAKNGGGLFRCVNRVIYNDIEDNYASSYGGGMAYCSGLVKGNRIDKNHGQQDGGAAFKCSSLFISNVISDNISNYGGAFSRCNGDILGNEFRNNRADYGGAIYACFCRVAFNRITENFANSHGGAFHKMRGGVIENNIIDWNTALANGGVFDQSHVLIKNNLIFFNLAEQNGGAFAFCDGEIYNNIIYDNVAFYGGALHSCSGDISNNVMYNNTAMAGGGVYECYTTIQNCILWGNGANIGDQIYASSDPAYCCIQSWEGAGNNISESPDFVNEMVRDFHLDFGSPCIDAGNPSEIYYDSFLPPGLGTILNDMGAYGGPHNGGWQKGMPSGTLAEINSSGELWIAENHGAPPFNISKILGWPGFVFDPQNSRIPLKGDFNSDGFDDLVQITEFGDAWVYINPETSYSTSRWGWLGFSYSETVDQNGDIPLTGDVDGDGDDDLIQVTKYTDVWVSLSSETRYDLPERWGWLGFRFKRGDNVNTGALPLSGDVDGDGDDDLIQVTEYGDIWVSLSGKSHFEAPKRWSWAGFSYKPEAGMIPLTGDFNGDGLCDLVQITANGDPWVTLSDGTGFITPSSWGFIDFVYNEKTGNYCLTADVNSDGRTDLIEIEQDGSAWVSFSQGNSFDVPEFWGNPGFHFSRNDGRLPFYLNY